MLNAPPLRLRSIHVTGLHTCASDSLGASTPLRGGRAQKALPRASPRRRQARLFLLALPETSAWRGICCETPQLCVSQLDGTKRAYFQDNYTTVI